MRFLKFLSLTTATQVCLLVNQLLLLPWQLRVWGNDLTAQWLVAVAIANVASMADLGMRNAGHAELLASVESNDPSAEKAFAAIWAITRMLFVVATAALLVAQFASAWAHGQSMRPWIAALTISLALDTLVIVRGIWLDTLGHFNKVEAVFLAMVAIRILLSFSALAVFHAPPAVLAWIALYTALAGVAGQAMLLRRPASLGLFVWKPGSLRLESLSIVRFVLAEPAANWVRLSLPVIVLAAISSPIFVTTFVALRAVFGVVRQVVNQIARYASVRYVQRYSASRELADSLASRAILASTIVSLAVATTTIVDHGRLLSYWLHGADVHVVSQITLSFALPSATYAYQIVTGILIRTGDVEGVAKRQYAYLLTAAIAALMALWIHSARFYLLFLIIQEIIIAEIFVSALGDFIARTANSAFLVAAVILAIIWGAVEMDPVGFFSAFTFAAIAADLLIIIPVCCIFAAVCLAIDRLNKIRSP